MQAQVIEQAVAPDTIVLAPITLSAEIATGPVDGVIPKRSATSTKTDTAISETPQIVNVVPRDQFEAQGASLVTETLRYTPGVLAESNGYDIRYDWYYIRGLESYGSMFSDGLSLPGDPSAFANPAIDPYTLERVEVIKGPASVLYGQTPPGGLINIVSKRPLDTARREVFVRTSSFGGAEVGADFTGPLTKDGNLTYRLVGVARNMGSQIDMERTRRIMLAPSLTWRPTDATSLTVYGMVQRDRDSFSPRFYPAYGTLLKNPAGQIPVNRFLGDPSADGFHRDYYAAGYSLEHEVSANWVVRQNLRYARSKQDMLLVLVNPAFAFPGPFPGVPGAVLNRVTGASDDELRNLAVDTQAQGTFTTGAAQHTLLLGIDYGWARSSANFGNSGPGVVPGLDYTDPDYGGIEVTRPAYTRSYLQERRQLGVYAQDQIELGRWTGVASLRWDKTRLDNTNRIAGTPEVRTRDNAVSGRIGLMYRFDNGLSPYAAYSTSFLPILGTDSAGNTFEASTAKMVEVGVKYAPAGSNNQLTASFYSMTQDGYLTPDPDNALFSVQGGKRRVNGVELEGKVAVTDQIDVIAAYAYSDSEILETTNAAALGKPMLRLPRHQGSLWVQYRDAGREGLDLSAGIRGLSDYSSDANYLPQLEIPGYAVVDLGLSYDLGGLSDAAKGARLQLNASNIFDKTIVAQCINITGGSCNYGEGREVGARISYEW